LRKDLGNDVRFSNWAGWRCNNWARRSD